MLKNDPRRRIVDALYELEVELRRINSIHNNIQDGFMHRFGLTYNHSTNASNSCNNNDEQVLTLIEMIRMVLSNLTLRIETLTYLHEVLLLLERVSNILTAIKRDVYNLGNSMSDILDGIGLGFINVNIDIEYSTPSHNIELPCIDGYSIVYELPCYNCQH